ncbi:MAG: hypothetical protein CMJ81_03940 [Planctomycetaceae bacterium]|nr:hypothetical protein [Planctomycetaceae bacterium]MBP60476.1 hypothetical protein [Planctomycetaceae bacterium]
MLVFVIGLVAGLIGLPVVVIHVGRRWRRAQRQALVDRAQREFPLQRQRVESQFRQQAASSGRPRGLVWKEVEFAEEVRFASNRQSGQLIALVSIAVSFEAVAGSEMEEVEAVGNLRAGSAVFYFEENRWLTRGRAIFNLDPRQSLQHFQNQWEPVRSSSAADSGLRR